MSLRKRCASDARKESMRWPRRVSSLCARSGKRSTLFLLTSKDLFDCLACVVEGQHLRWLYLFGANQNEKALLLRLCALLPFLASPFIINSDIGIAMRVSSQGYGDPGYANKPAAVLDHAARIQRFNVMLQPVACTTFGSARAWSERVYAQHRAPQRFSRKSNRRPVWSCQHPHAGPLTPALLPTRC